MFMRPSSQAAYSAVLPNFCSCLLMVLASATRCSSRWRSRAGKSLAMMNSNALSAGVTSFLGTLPLSLALGGMVCFKNNRWTDAWIWISS